MRRVVKVGGSLLGRRDLIGALSTWFDAQSAGETLVVVGGGRLVDAVRDLDAIRPADPVETHWLCVDLLDITFRLLRDWFPWPAAHTEAQLEQGLACGFSLEHPTLVAVKSFYGRDRNGSEPLLPQDWRTTTDSIAALLARQVSADELVLLKSCDIEGVTDLGQLASAGVLDEAFPTIARHIASIRIERL